MLFVWSNEARKGENFMAPYASQLQFYIHSSNNKILNFIADKSPRSGLLAGWRVVGKVEFGVGD